MLYPIKTAPIFKQYIWGGDNLKTKFGKEIPDGFAAESWEISCHPDGLSSAANGLHKGSLLADIIKENPKEMLGGERQELSLLVKLIDANDRLSVQVHPNNEIAKSLEGGVGKTEMWYVVDAKPDAKIVYGLKDGVDADAFRKAIDEGRVEEVLNYVPVKAGDSFFIPAGTVHAIGEGILIAEVQQNSNITYRVYDYDRVDKDGNRRELHTEKAILAANYGGTVENKIISARTYYGNVYRLAACEHFTVVKHVIRTKVKLSQANDQYELMICVAGSGRIVLGEDIYEFSAGDSFFLPAAMDAFWVEGECQILRAYETL